MEQVNLHNVITMRMADGNVVKFERHAALPSTAALAKEYVRAGYPDRYVIFAEAKETESDASAKRGAKTCPGIYMSIILRPNFFPSQAPFLGPLSAVSLVTALEEHTDRELGIGWVSDVFCDGERIGKSSIEARLDASGAYEYLIVSFSADLSPQKFPPLLGDMVLQVFTENAGSISMIIAKGVLNRFFPLYSALRTSQKFLDTYRQKFLLRGVRVTFTDDAGKKRAGKVTGLDPKDLSLLVESHGETVRIAKIASVRIPDHIRLKKPVRKGERS